MSNHRNKRFPGKTYAEWAADVVQLFRLAGYGVHEAWVKKLPRYFDWGWTPTDAVRYVIQGGTL